MDRLKQIVGRKNPLKRAEGMCSILENTEGGDIALIPTHSNFQMPEVFLSTRILPECEAYFMQESEEMSKGKIEEWNERVDRVMEDLSVDFVIMEAQKAPPSEISLLERVQKTLGYTK
ncbi:uncharacterized protein NEMAJ01_2215 [Nematocida major]|uniref:uncharacterized protein n=1 Tax=Nematocida major TaxID=1912982 RepID=UPI0020088894|nr:uncharacterized protein NEMAJ01_2215 [Nematocida major]KAH9387319.1 hypothetical protein NEMAJ01_2215 [Nematocida major]